MEAASAPSTSTSFQFSLAHAVLTISLNFVFFWLSAIINSSSSSTSCSSSRRSAAATPTAVLDEEETARGGAGAAAAAAVVDLDAVLGLMGAAAEESVGFEEAAALFEEEEATVQEAASAFRVFDRNGDGFIDAGELGSVLRSLGFAAGSSAEDCQRMIDAYDADKDGRIDFHEFLKFMETTTA